MDEALTDSERIRRFEVTTGVEVVVHGDESRLRLACRVIEEATPSRLHRLRVMSRLMRMTMAILPVEAVPPSAFQLRPMVAVAGT